MNFDYKELTEDELQELKKDPTNQDWHLISWRKSLSEDFMREFKYYIVFEAISYSQILSEDFIREYKDRVHWGRIGYRQNLSIKFIAEFIDKLKIKNLLYNVKISREIKDYCRMFV